MFKPLPVDPDLEEPRLYASETRLYELLEPDMAERFQLTFHFDQGDRFEVLGYLEYLEFVPTLENDLHEIFMLHDALTGDSGVAFSTVEYLLDDDPFRRVIYVARVFVAEEFRGHGVARFMLLAAPVLLKERYDSVVIWPFVLDDDEGTQGLRRLVESVGYMESPVDGALYIQDCGEEGRDRVRAADQILASRE